MSKKRELTSLPLNSLETASGGIKWEDLPRSDKVEDRRPHVVCTPFWPRGDKGPSLAGGKATDPSSIKVGK